MKAKYVHTNLIADDWRSLADFYQKVFGCVPVPPERDLQGEKLEAGTGISGAHLRGVHLRLPGYGENGPTLEIFSYETLAERVQAAVNRPGFAHIAFQVEDVSAARQEVLAAGGRSVGEVVRLQIGDGRQVTWCYVTDPEGNVIELQAWGEDGGMVMKISDAKMRILWVVLFAAAILFAMVIVAVFFLIQRINQEVNSVSVSTDKQEYQAGDIVHISIRNSGDRPIGINCPMWCALATFPRRLRSRWMARGSTLLAFAPALSLCLGAVFTQATISGTLCLPKAPLSWKSLTLSPYGLYRLSG